jgi:hypothetical protein
VEYRSFDIALVRQSNGPGNRQIASVKPPKYDARIRGIKTLRRVNKSECSRGFFRVTALPKPAGVKIAQTRDSRAHTIRELTRRDLDCMPRYCWAIIRLRHACNISN